MRLLVHRLTLAAFAVALGGIVAQQAEAGVVYDLVDGDNNLEFQVGDKIFSDFSCQVQTNSWSAPLGVDRFKRPFCPPAGCVDPRTARG